MGFLLSFMPAACKSEPELYVGMFWYFFTCLNAQFSPPVLKTGTEENCLASQHVFRVKPRLGRAFCSPSSGAFPKLSSQPATPAASCCSELLYHICTDRAHHWLSFVFLMPIFLIMDLWLSANQLHFWGLLLDFGCQAEFFLTVHNNSNSLTSTMRQLTFLKLSASGSASERFPLQNRQLPLLNNLLLFNLILVPK